MTEQNRNLSIRLLTSALPHGGIVHLLFNVIWLWIFGTAIEAVWGPVRTLAATAG